MRKTFLTLLIICMLAVLLTGCMSANNGVQDVVPTPAPFSTPYPSRGLDLGPNNGGLGAMSMPEITVPVYTV